MTRVALDTNVLAYWVGVDRHPDDARKIAAAMELVDALAAGAELVAPVQALGELFGVLLKAGQPRTAARATVGDVMSGLGVAPSRSETFQAALDLATEHKLQLWDALVLSAAAEAGCSLLLSEDMQPGFTARGVAVVNPFAAERDQRLLRLLD